MLKKLWQFLLNLNDWAEENQVDKLIHTIFCFTAIYFNQATIAATIFVAFLVEFEQWNCLRRPGKTYILNKLIPDLIADAAGILLAVVFQIWN
jgi:VanZ family protein